jgi:hypothetical protein
MRAQRAFHFSLLKDSLILDEAAMLQEIKRDPF